MKLIRFLFALLFISSSLTAQDETDSSTLILEFKDESYKELTLSEWKKFKNLEKKLSLIKKPKTNQELQLRGYVRDSIQILGVKLMAVKLLEERKLLRRDITENTEYYLSLVEELRDSGIPKSEYLFLEEKIAYLNLEILEEQLIKSRWAVTGLFVACLGLIGVVFYLRKKQQKEIIPELSRQEITVRNLIMQGKSNKEIANELFISLSTVKSHITNLYGKLNVANRQELFHKGTGAST
ncbi:helix-turn-helix transcriptional regulator [uncultured Croceitalea sp.]|uniref:response regulator transcription factor n=1 Tax=uncultured Croceitalea sp. TaxID=1798908 RepID=UPI00330645B1